MSSGPRSAPPPPPDLWRPGRSGPRHSCPICGCDDCQCISSIPQELIKRAQWVTWCYVERNGKRTKMPFNSKTGGGADSTHPETWGTLAEALDAMTRRQHDGIGYVFAPDDPYAGVDLDGCRNKETGEIADWARSIIDSFASYAEISPSGEGVHILIRASMPGGKGCKRKPYEDIVKSASSLSVAYTWRPRRRRLKSGKTNSGPSWRTTSPNVPQRPQRPQHRRSTCAGMPP